jgi:hypothetical protein
MKIRAMIVAAALLLVTASSFAEPSGWTANVTITKLVATQNGGVNVRVSPDLNNCVSQSGYGPNFASIYPTHPGINKIQADLLAAYLSGTKVSLWLSDNNCTVGEIIVGGW